MALGVKALAAKLYWTWCKNQDQDWPKILAVELQDIPRLELDGKGSFIWDTLKRGTPLIKEGLFWICTEGLSVLF